MFTDERKALILQELTTEGRMSIPDLAKRFNVSTETIRRDLAQLGDEKKLVKVRGGAISMPRPIKEDSYDIRAKKNHNGKQAIGRFAASLIHSGDVVGLDYGATATEIALALLNVTGVTIVTHSFDIATVLADKRARGDFDGRILFVGGMIDQSTAKTSGLLSLSFMEQFSLDKVFLCTTAVSVSGLMMWDEQEGEYSAALARQASKAYVVADSSKLGKESFYKFLGYDSVSEIITDDEHPVSSSLRHALETHDVNLRIVACSAQPRV
ncbi:MAG: DeoR/GlpR family DNA-binding transcription regulator [Clostridia bacterium]